MNYIGDFAEDETVYFMFNTFTSDDPSASCTITNFINTDVHIHKDDGLTQRNNAAGITVSANFDGITGSHMIKIDTNDNTVGGFWVAGADYFIRIEGTTIDGATINAVVGHFSIQNRFMRGTNSAATATALSTHDGKLDTVDGIVDNILTDTGTTLDGKLNTIDTVVDGIQTDLSNATDGLGALKALIDTVDGIVDNILTDTGTTLDGKLTSIETKVDTVDTVADGIQTDLSNATDGLGALKSLIDTVDGVVDNILTDTGTTLENHLTDIKGTGFVKDTDSLPQCLTATGFSTHSAANVWAVAARTLTANTNFNDLDAAAIKAEVVAALADIKLDHLINIAVDTNWATTVHLDSVIGHLADVGTAATFDRTTDAQEAIRDRGDAEWITATGFNTVVPDAAGVAPTVTEIRQEMDTNSTKMAPSQVLNDYKATGFNTVVPDAAGVAPTAAEIKTEVEQAGSSIAQILADTDNLQTNQGNWLTATGFSTHNAAAVWSVAARVLTANTNFNDLTAAEVKAEVAAALQDIKLDHLINSAVDTNWATTVHLDSVVGHMADVGTAATFNRTTDALEAIRNRGDGAWITATGFNTTTPPTVVQIRQEMDTNSTKMAPSQVLNDYKATGFNTVVPDAAGIAAGLHATTDGLITTVDTVADGIQTDLSNATDGLGALKTLIDTIDGVVDAILVDTGTTLNDMVERILGISQENFYIDSTVFTGANMTSCRIRLYSVAGSVGTASDVIATYNMTTTYAGDNLASYKMVKA